jgi:2-polyprenyl-3-methyl-5-hydroxy-6-metoxy-1,4-benzoquinol methylase
MAETNYTLDNAWQEARRRLRLLEAWLDPGTIRHLESLGVAEGWQCLEVGGGGGSVTEWLCGRVGTTGRVVATDINTQFLDAIQAPNLEVRRHDIVAEALPTRVFDLVHARMVLTHLADRQQGLQRMVAALKPGGWLLVEEMDCMSWLADPSGELEAVVLFTKGAAAIDRVMSEAGVNLYYGRRLFGDVRASGLGSVAGEGRVLMVYGGTPNAQELQLTATQLFSRSSAAGLLSEPEQRDFLELLGQPDFVWMSQTILAVWGQR